MSSGELRMNTVDHYYGEVIPPSLAIKAMRDNGYKNTAYALAELIDNSIQAAADMVEVICVEKNMHGRTNLIKRIAEIGVLDNGTGMDDVTLLHALQFGNGTRLEDRSGIGRFGMGLPNASISQCRRVDVWTWEAGPDNALHTHLDLDEIEAGKTRVVAEPMPRRVPDKWRSRSKNIDTHGTLVVWSDFEYQRLTWKKAVPTLDNIEILSGRMYRKFISEGKVQIRLVAVSDDGTLKVDRNARVNDPLYLMTRSSTPAPFDEEPMFQRWGEADESFKIMIDGGEPHTVSVRMSWARPATISENGSDRGGTQYGKHAAKNLGLSIVRAGRELELDSSWANSYDPRERWWGVEVEFPPALDEIFGVTNNKQAATVFSHMAQFDWTREAEEGETYIEYKRRLEEEGDTRHLLMDIVDYIRQQLTQIRSRLQDQTKGRRGPTRRHVDVGIEDKATTKIEKRIEEGHRAESDDQEFDDNAEEQLVDDLVNKNFDEKVARELARAVRIRGRRVLFIDAEVDALSFFNVDVRPGGVTEIIFNSSHPAYEKLVKTLDADVAESSPSELADRIQNASDTLRLLFAAWARYEEEDVTAKKKLRQIRSDWGRMAEDYLEE